MEEILNALLDAVREQQRNGVPPEAAMSRSDVVNMALKMMQQQGIEIEQDTVTEAWRMILRLAPNLFGSDTSDVPAAALSPADQIIRHMEPDKKITEGNENIQLDKMIFNNFQSMLGGSGGEIDTEPSAPAETKPQTAQKPKSAAELAADAIRQEEENKKKGITPPAPKPGKRRPITNKKKYKGIPKASNTIRGDDSQGISASQLAYEAQRKAKEQTRAREEQEKKRAEETMNRGEPNPRIAAAEEKAKKEAAQKETASKRKEAESSFLAQTTSATPAKQETPEEKRARVEAEQEARRAREWAEAEAEAKAAKEKAILEKEQKAIAEAARERKEKNAQQQKEKEKLSQISTEEEKDSKEKAKRREQDRKEATAAKEAKTAKTRQEAAKLIQQRVQSKTEKAAQTTKKAVESIQQGMAAVLGDGAAEEINEEELNHLVMAKYQELVKGGTRAADIDMAKLTSLVIEALAQKSQEAEEPEQDLDDLIDEAWGDKKLEPKEKESKQEKIETQYAKGEPEPEKGKTEFKKEEPESEKEKTKPEKGKAETKKEEEPKKREPKPEKRKTKPKSEDFTISFSNVKSLMVGLEEFLDPEGKARKARTGIEPVDQLLPSGLEPGLYIVEAEDSIGADAFELQVGDYLASHGRDVLFLLSDSSRYSMMVKSISRLTYELRGKDKKMARSLTSIMNCKSKADMANLRKEFAYYEEHIGEHLYLLEQKTMDGENITELIPKIAAAFQEEKQTNPVILLDDIFWMIGETSELIGDLANLAKEMEFPILFSVGSAHYVDKERYSTQICIQYSEMDKDKRIQKDFEAENGETLLADLNITRADTGKYLHARMAVTPKFYHFDKAAKGIEGC